MLLVDGNHLAARSRHAKTKRLTTATGSPSGVVYGVFNGLSWAKSLLGMTPQQIIVFWDNGRSLRRMQLYPGYKAGRTPEQPTPEQVAEQQSYYLQLDAIASALPFLGIRQCKIRNVEADDLIGIYSRLYESLGRRVVIYTGDHDIWQCASEKVLILDPTDEVLNLQQILHKANLPDTESIVRLKSLAGDKSDAIDGVPKIGDVRARKLLPYWDELFQDKPLVLDESFQKYVDIVKANIHIVQRNEFLVRIPRSWDVSLYEQDVVQSAVQQLAQVHPRNTAKFIQFCRAWELNSLIERIDQW